MKRPETPKEWLERYEKKLWRAQQNYQETGDAKYDRQVEEFEVVTDGLVALIQKQEERQVDIKKRITNRDAVIDRLIKDNYSRGEVLELLRDAVYW